MIETEKAWATGQPCGIRMIYPRSTKMMITDNEIPLSEQAYALAIWREKGADLANGIMVI